MYVIFLSHTVRSRAVPPSCSCLRSGDEPPSQIPLTQRSHQLRGGRCVIRRAERVPSSGITGTIPAKIITDVNIKLIPKQ